jgi:hypothetical protein
MSSRFVSRPRKHCLVFAFVATICAGCDQRATPTSPTNPGGGDTASIDQSITLAPGQRTIVPGTSLSVGFTSVSHDSRCPADALCIQLGEAAMAFVASLPPQGDAGFELKTSKSEHVEQIGPYRIELVTLQPYPFSARPIEPGEYRATLRVSTP